MDGRQFGQRGIWRLNYNVGRFSNFLFSEIYGTYDGSLRLPSFTTLVNDANTTWNYEKYSGTAQQANLWNGPVQSYARSLLRVMSGDAYLKSRYDDESGIKDIFSNGNSDDNNAVDNINYVKNNIETMFKTHRTATNTLRPTYFKLTTKHWEIVQSFYHFNSMAWKFGSSQSIQTRMWNCLGDNISNLEPWHTDINGAGLDLYYDKDNFAFKWKFKEAHNVSINDNGVYWWTGTAWARQRTLNESKLSSLGNNNDTYVPNPGSSIP